MHKIIAIISIFLGVLACTPEEEPLEEEKKPDTETPSPKPEPDYEQDPEPAPVFETSYEAVANMGVG